MGSKNAHVMSAIEQDIRNRGLRPGQPYCSAREIADRLDVSPMTADRAMRRLADSGILIRRHGAGTFVGAALADRLAAEVRYLQIFIPANFYNAYRVIVENIVATLHQAFPRDRIEQVFISDAAQESFCRQLVRAWRTGEAPRAVVLVGCGLPVQRLFAEQGIPVVATGGVSKTQSPLPWIDMDHRESGRLLGHWAASLGHRRVLILMNHLWGCGDNDFLDGLEEGLRPASGKPIEARVRSVDVEGSDVESVLREAFQRGNPPGALICTARRNAEIAVRIAEDRGLRIPEDFAVATVLVRTPSGPPPRYTYTRWATTRETNDALRTMVRQLIRGMPPDPAQFLIPVELVTPGCLDEWI